MSAKVDVYAFGVVLYELISAKSAVVKLNESSGEFRGLVGVVSIIASSTLVFLIQDMYSLFTYAFFLHISQFEEAFKETDKEEAIRKIVDPRLGDNYPFDSVYKVIFLWFPKFFSSFYFWCLIGLTESKSYRTNSYPNGTKRKIKRLKLEFLRYFFVKSYNSN